MYTQVIIRRRKISILTSGVSIIKFMSSAINDGFDLKYRIFVLWSNPLKTEAAKKIYVNKWKSFNLC